VRKYADCVKVIIQCTILIAFVFIAQRGFSTNYYVDFTNGTDANNGTSISSPFKTITKAVGLSALVGGDTIYVRGGTYTFTSSPVKLTKSGTSGHLISLLVYPGDTRPILDFSSMALGSSNRGVSLQGSYWHVKGIRIKGAGDNGMNISGANNIVEFCDFYENRDGGCQLGSGAHDNQIINCDSYHNADWGTGSTTNGGNADGFSPKLDVGTGNYFYGCRSYYNSDDGWDGYMTTSSDITTTLENCWTWHNGYVRLTNKDTTTDDMNGNGFKMGGDYLVHNMILKNCLSFNNKAKGFDQNHNMGSMTLYNCTSKSNGGKNFSISEAVNSGKTITIENCISYETSSKSILSTAVVATNSWDSKYTVTSADFESIDTTGISAARKADGSLPDVTFMRLVAGSDLIDAGTDVGLTYKGKAPDLGCFEYGSNLTADKTILTLTADNKSKTYGDANPELTFSYSGFLNGDDADSLTTPVVISTTATIDSGVGSYPITLSGGTSPNYTFSYVDGTLVVNKAGLTAIIDDKSKAYGEANPSFTASFTGFVNGEDTSILDAHITIGSTATIDSSVGTYPITISGTLPNYTISSTNGTLTINKAALTIKADNKSQTYGDTVALTLSYIGFVNNDKASGLTTPAIVNTSATTDSPAGTYPITVSGASSPNYTISYVDGELLVNPAPLTATAHDTSKTYGNANPSFTATFTGIVNNDDAYSFVTINTEADQASGTGTYTITISGSSPNYNISFTNGTLTVNKAELTITAKDTSRAYGEANPVFTLIYNGFVNGDDSSKITVPTVTCLANAQSDAGKYDISLTGGAADNYSIQLVNGILTITPATGISETEGSGIQIYPNPASNKLTIARNSNNPTTILIINNKGQVVMEKQLFSEKEDIDIHLLSKGVYILRLLDVTYKLIVQ
jgi:hypothetical protein